MTSLPESGDSSASEIAPGVMPAQQPAQHLVRRTRVGGWWIASVLFALMLLLLLIFILENGQRANIAFLGVHGHLPLGVALLLAAVLGILLVVIPGTGRIIQLRMLAVRHRDIDARRSASNQEVPTMQPPTESA